MIVKKTNNVYQGADRPLLWPRPGGGRRDKTQIIPSALLVRSIFSFWEVWNKRWTNFCPREGVDPRKQGHQRYYLLLKCCSQAADILERSSRDHNLKGFNRNEILTVLRKSFKIDRGWCMFRLVFWTYVAFCFGVLPLSHILQGNFPESTEKVKSLTCILAI